MVHVLVKISTHNILYTAARTSAILGVCRIAFSNLFPRLLPTPAPAGGHKVRCLPIVSLYFLPMLWRATFCLGIPFPFLYVSPPNTK